MWALSGRIKEPLGKGFSSYAQSLLNAEIDPGQPGYWPVPCKEETGIQITQWLLHYFHKCL